MKPYIKLTYKFVDVDWNVGPKGEFVETYMPARACKKSDLGGSEEGNKEFDLWKGYSMICPDFENSGLKDETWLLTGSPSSFAIKRGDFVIERCRGESYCHSDEVIDKFISDL